MFEETRNNPVPGSPREKAQANSLCRDLVEGLTDFANKLESGEPIQATRMERYDTPDGPMHVSRKVMLRFVDGEKVEA